MFAAGAQTPERISLRARDDLRGSDCLLWYLSDQSCNHLPERLMLRAATTIGEEGREADVGHMPTGCGVTAVPDEAVPGLRIEQQVPPVAVRADVDLTSGLGRHEGSPFRPARMAKR